ncbi:MAG: hypothetical protein IPK20_21060 [Betaproteobacteria bacterium]|nr:hypothetical protein [Betaproteobacteria bacterium]
MMEHPRAQIITGAWGIAQHYAPLGSGLGTFGGAGAAKFDQSLYEDLGFGRYWWFGKRDYLLDTYWPSALAESGFIGAALLFLAYLAMVMYATHRFRQSMDKARTYWAIAAAGMLYMLLTSATSPAFQDPRLFLLPALMIGLAHGVSRSVSKKDQGVSNSDVSPHRGSKLSGNGRWKPCANRCGRVMTFFVSKQFNYGHCIPSEGEAILVLLRLTVKAERFVTLRLGKGLVQ